MTKLCWLPFYVLRKEKLVHLQIETIRQRFYTIYVFLRFIQSLFLNKLTLWLDIVYARLCLQMFNPYQC